MMITPLEKIEILKRVRATLSEPGAWVKGSYARDAEMAVVYPYSPEAVSWCLLGCIKKHTHMHKDWEEEIRFDLQGVIYDELPANRMGVTTFNDLMNTEIDDVLSIIDKTIERIDDREVEVAT